MEHRLAVSATVVALTLSANLASAQPGPPREACNVLQAQWASAWPNSSRSRDLDENRQYSSGYRVGSPIEVDGGGPTNWHALRFKLVNQASPNSFYLNEVDGQIHTYSKRFDHEQRSSYPLSVEAWLLGGPKNRKDPSGAQKYCNERINHGCGDCRLQTITVNVSISDEPERPERPAAPRVAGVHGSLTVSWDLVWTNPDIDSYDVQWRAGPGGPFVDGPQGVSGTSATMNDLNPIFDYRVRMRAANILGDGAWSPTTAAKTTPPPTPPPEPPPPQTPEPVPVPVPDPDPVPPPPPPPPDPEPVPPPPPPPPTPTPTPTPPPTPTPTLPEFAAVCLAMLLIGVGAMRLRRVAAGVVCICFLVPLLASAQGVPVTLTLAAEQARKGYERPTTNRYQRHERAVYLDLGMDRTPYTCTGIGGDLTGVDVEHIVALAEAHDSGLSPAQMLAFSGDPLNLTVAAPRENRTVKSDKDAAGYLPPRNRCWFAGRVLAVKSRWELTVDADEAGALIRGLWGCDIRTIQRPSC